MKITLAPDSFKGSISALDFVRIAHDEIKKFNKDIIVYEMPLADGGEGSLEIIHLIKGGSIKYFDTFDAYMKKISVPVLFINNEAFIESAKVIGLCDKKNPLLATSYGLGLLINEVIKETSIINVFLGGTATNDAGEGMLKALGKMDEIKFNVMCDVTNQLYGENGATKVFSRQKGASESDMEILEKRIIDFSFGKEEFVNRIGAGSAGGLGFAFMAYLNATYYSGIDYIIDLYDYDKSSIVITGEGKYDSQSKGGKVISGLKRIFSNVICFCGIKEVDEENVICLNSSIDINDTEVKLRIALRKFLEENYNEIR